MQEVTPDIARLLTGFSNVYFVGKPGEPWFLVDTGVPGFAGVIRKAAEERYGVGIPPKCIVLTHGHFDHAGSALALAQQWDVPIYAHPLEMPYLTGMTIYPPFDPTVGGFLAFLLRFIPQKKRDLRPHIHELTEADKIPGLPDWQWLFTPGHAPGHISLWRDSDKTLIVGDAFATVNVDSAFDVLTQKPEISNPPNPANCDYEAAGESIRKLANLEPETIACGHGVALSGPEVSGQLNEFTILFHAPTHGRYVSEPAVTDENGIVSLPSTPPDPFPRIAASVGLVALVGIAAATLFSRRRANGDEEED